MGHLKNFIERDLARRQLHYRQMRTNIESNAPVGKVKTYTNHLRRTHYSRINLPKEKTVMPEL